MVALATLALAVSQSFSSPIANPEAEAQIGPEPVGPVIIDEVSSLFLKMYSSYHLVIWYENEKRISNVPELVAPVIIDKVSSLFLKMYNSYHLIIWYKNEKRISNGPELVGPVIIDEVSSIFI